MVDERRIMNPELFTRLNVEEQKEVVLKHLIPKVEARPQCWDTRIPGYKKGGKDYQNAFIQIAKEMQAIVGKKYHARKVKTTWQNIRKSYIVNYFSTNGHPNYDKTDVLAFLDPTFTFIPRLNNHNAANQAMLDNFKEDLREEQTDHDYDLQLCIRDARASLT